MQTGASGFIKKEDKEKYLNMFKQMEQDHEEIMKNEEKGEEYMRDMCSYELWNHEYGYTYELEDAVRTMGYTMESIQKEEKLYKILLEEAKKIRESEEV